MLPSRFSRVRLCTTPETAAHQAPPSLGFSKQNTGVGCHFLLQCMKVKSESEVAQSRPHGLQPTRLLRPWDFPGKSTGVGCHCLLQIKINPVKIKTAIGWTFYLLLAALLLDFLGEKCEFCHKVPGTRFTLRV